MTELMELERRLRGAVGAIPPPIRPELLRVLTLPDEERAAAIGRLYQDRLLPHLAELLIDLEEEPTARALVVGQLRELLRPARGR